MCGILGYSGKKFRSEDIEYGLAKISYRGPDETVITKLNEGSIFAMNRLAIRDQKKGLYPFRYNQYTLIFNGEIYNSEALKKHIDVNYRFKTRCDAEVILPLFDKYGPQIFARFTGMFALAIYDSEKNTVYLARDQFGEKPLYYSHKEESLFFGSEIGAFPRKYCTLDQSAITEYLALGFRTGNKTFYKEVYKVEPGQYIEYCCHQNKLTKHSYVKTELKKTNISLKKLDSCLNEIIEQKMVSDVPLGVFLSGGIDSGLIAHLASKFTNNKLFSYSICIDDNKLNESVFARLIAKKIQTEHMEIRCSAQDILQNWHIVVDTQDEPICDPALFPTFLLAKAAKKKCKVILTGEGADEIFAGYSRYFHEKLVEQYLGLVRKKLSSFLPIQLLNFLLWKVVTPIRNHYTSIPYKSLWLNGVNSQKKYGKTIELSWKKMQLADTTSDVQLPQLYDLRNYVPEQLCMKIDKITMLHSIEARAPLLDRRLLKYMKPSIQCYANSKKNKPLLKMIAQNYLPKEIVHQPKKSFALPLECWLKNELFKKVLELRNPHPALAKQLSQHTLEQLIKAAEHGNSKLSLTIWNVLTLNSWLKFNFPVT